MPNMQAKISQLHGLINEANTALNKAKNLLRDLESANKVLNVPVDNTPGTYGVFMGDHMLADSGEKFPVPENYASKSNLVYGDKLKMTEENNEKRFKQVERVKRFRTEGVLAKKEGKWHAVTSDSSYRVLDISVAHFNLTEGDLVTVLLPAENKFVPYAAIEHTPVSTPAPSTGSGTYVLPKDELKPKVTEIKLVSPALEKPVVKKDPRPVIADVAPSKPNVTSGKKRKPLGAPKPRDNASPVTTIIADAKPKDPKVEPSRVLTEEDLR